MAKTSDLCDLCAQLDLVGAVLGLAPTDASSDWASTSEITSPWFTSLEEVSESAGSCHLCALVIKGWRECREMSVETTRKTGDYNERNPPTDLLFDILDIESYLGPDAVTLAIHHTRRQRLNDSEEPREFFYVTATCKISGSVGSWEAKESLSADFRVVMDFDAGSRFRPRHKILECVDKLVSEDPMSERCLRVAHGWLQNCVAHHGDSCRAPSTTNIPSWKQMPTRVLEIPPDGAQIYLRLTQANKPSDSRYTALSHCWGKSDDPFITTKANFRSRMEGIDISDLPPTFRDAVAVSQALGIPYLWIDSLCIIQHDLQDWQLESAKMADVYRNAYLVVGAASSSADTGGFLATRLAQNTVRLPRNSYGTPVLQLLPPQDEISGRRWTHNQTIDPLAAEPTTQRAWCLQERILPRRLLQYGSQQLFWECEQIRASEDGDSILNAGSNIQNLCKGATIHESVFHRGARRPPREGEVQWIEWYEMVQQYTCREITNPEDTLPALSGLADAIARSINDDSYIAGLWKGGLVEGLCWCRKDSNEMLSRPKAYIAPSWSWASVKGAVQFPIYNWYRTRAFWKAHMADFESLADFVGFSPVLKDGNKYGRLEKASLELKAPLVPVCSVQPRPVETPQLRQFIHGQDPYRSQIADCVFEIKQREGQRLWIEGSFDVPSEENASNLSILFLTRMPHILVNGFMEHRFGLLVRKLNTGVYERVGLIDGCILESQGDSLKRWRELLPEHWKQEDPEATEEDRQDSVNKSLAYLDELESDFSQEGTLDHLEYAGYFRHVQEEWDMYNFNPPNPLAKDPIPFDITQLTLV